MGIAVGSTAAAKRFKHPHWLEQYESIPKKVIYEIAGTTLLQD